MPGKFLWHNFFLEASYSFEKNRKTGQTRTNYIRDTCGSTARYGMRTFWPPKAEFFVASWRGTVWGNGSVSLPRDGNGTGAWKATLLMERDYAISWRNRTWRVRGTGREYGREIGRHIVGNSVGKMVGRSVENTVGKRCREWWRTRWGTGAGDIGWKRGGNCYRVLYIESR